MIYTNNFNPIISDEQLFDDIVKEQDYIGYYNLFNQNREQYKKYALTVTQSNLVIIGIGGSTLGTYAIYKYLKYSKELKKKIIFLETTDPVDIHSKIKNINLHDALFIVISKSGSTIETISIFKYLHSIIKIDKTNSIIITENSSKLDKYAKVNNIKTFIIPRNVGGRFSVFTAVGLVPLAIVGIDIDKILDGIEKTHNSFFSKGYIYDRIIKKSRFFVEYKNQFNINVVFSYSSRLEGFNKWYIQLWGESLGKVDLNNSRQGLTPVGIIGPIDQHSFLQLIIEGKRDKSVTVIKIDDFNNNLSIPNITLEGLEDFDYLNNINFASLINQQADATIESINQLGDIPCDVLNINGVCESAISSLMYEYELLTSVTAKFMHIDAYNQPGVENGKIILNKKIKNQNKDKNV